MSDYKTRIRKATEAYQRNQDRQQQPKRKNKSPEKDLTQKPCVILMRSLGFDVNIIESKSVWSEERGRYIAQAVDPGFLDCVANDPNGYAIFVEFKAPGCIAKLRDNQRKFINRKINSGAFAMVTDGPHKLNIAYQHWLNLKKANKDAKTFLLSLVPKPRPDKDPNDLPW